MNSFNEIRNRILHEKNYKLTGEDTKILLQALSEFKLGQYLIKNKSLNGYWTDFVVNHPKVKSPLYKNELESLLLNKFPTVKATQERYQLFLKANQERISENAVVASIPSGLCGDLLYLDYTGVDKIKIIAIDNDVESLSYANKLATDMKLAKFFESYARDAWNLGVINEFDLISSNGLNIYEPNPDAVVRLYKEFYVALKNGGKLVTSFLTTPPFLAENSEWDMQSINQEDLLLQTVLFRDVIEAKWQCYSTSSEIKSQLESIGYRNIQFKYDTSRIFPTVTCYK